MKKPWTRETMLRKLKALLLLKDTQVRFLPMDKITARVDWDPGTHPSNLRIQVDVDKDGAIRCVIHELLHVLLHDEMNWADGALEEVVVLALEEDLYEYVKKSPRRITGWRKAIDARHVEGTETE